jgi:cell division septum initiation protein DivIVA
MGRWDKELSQEDILMEIHNLQMKLFHRKNRRKYAMGRKEVERIDSKIKNSYQKMRELYERNLDKFQSDYWDKANGFECFAWYLMLSDDTQKRFR